MTIILVLLGFRNHPNLHEDEAVGGLLSAERKRSAECWVLSAECWAEAKCWGLGGEVKEESYQHAHPYLSFSAVPVLSTIFPSTQYSALLCKNPSKKRNYFERKYFFPILSVIAWPERHTVIVQSACQQSSNDLYILWPAHLIEPVMNRQRRLQCAELHCHF